MSRRDPLPGRMALVSILNGVFLDVMPQITVSFALSALSEVPETSRYAGLEAEIINFGYSRSGYSFAEKLRMLEEERGVPIEDAGRAADLYAKIKEDLTSGADLVEGVAGFLERARRRGSPIFTTSVVPQPDLDRQMTETALGARLMPLLDEALGARPGCEKLIGHLRYIAESYARVRGMYLLFDAPAEVSMGDEARRHFDVRVVGVAVPAAPSAIISCFARGLASLERHRGASPVSLGLSEGQLALPSAEELTAQLYSAGADKVFTLGDSTAFDDIALDLEAAP